LARASLAVRVLSYLAYVKAYVKSSEHICVCVDRLNPKPESGTQTNMDFNAFSTCPTVIRHTRCDSSPLTGLEKCPFEMDSIAMKTGTSYTHSIELN
jgi:hypothetical protein